jgi:DNA-3-methyladenine glycosylase
MILPESFYTRKDVVKIAQELLGKVLVTRFNGIITSGMITEAEAYAGISDKASHAYGNRRTNRTDIMFWQGGVAYVYLCYGIHHLFNVVTNKANIPHAVLIRAIEPLEGIGHMLERRGKESITPALTAGPGALSGALGIHTSNTGNNLLGVSSITIEDRGLKIKPEDIVSSKRIGVDYAQEDALLPYRFYIRDNKFVSKSKQ